MRNQEKSACTVTVPKERGEVSFRYNDLDITTGTTLINPDMKFSFGKNFSIKEPLENNPGTGNDYHFDGRAVVVWSCESGICYHKFDVVDPEHCDMENPTEACDPEIGNFDDGNSTFFKDTDIKADNKPGETLDSLLKYLILLLVSILVLSFIVFKSLKKVNN